MRKPLCITAASLLVLLPVVLKAQENFMPEATPTEEQGAEGLKFTLIRPSDKEMIPVKDTERNPFSRGDVAQIGPEAKGSSEENDIRDRLTRLRVVGVSPGPKGLRVMLGDIVLEQGEIVPQVLTEQTVTLRVGRITPQAIELVWLEKKPSGLPPRLLTIPVDLRPYVRSVLQGQPNEKNQWEKSAPSGAKLPVATEFPTTTAGTSSPAATANAPAPETASTGSPSAPTHGHVSAPTPGSAHDGSEGAPPATAIKPVPQFEEAMKLLQALMPTNKGGAKP